MPTPKNAPNVADTLCRVHLIEAELETALQVAQKLIELGREVDVEEWGQGAWDREANWEIQELRVSLEELQNLGTLV